MKWRLVFGFLGTAFLSSGAPAFPLLQKEAPVTPQRYEVQSGTGFFVSKYGHIITNEHVVRGCDTVMVRGAVSPTEARVIKTDTENDLALLLAQKITPPYVAAIRAYGDPISKGDEVLVMGYPEDSAKTGVHKIAEAKIIDTAGPTGQPKWLQFSDAARQGNSGGPLLDRTGNVVGVVVGKSTLREINPNTKQVISEKKSDLAIALPYLTKFLSDNQVLYWKMYSGLHSSTPFIETRAKDYIVNVHCVQ
jgi:serine protease Do